MNIDIHSHPSLKPYFRNNEKELYETFTNLDTSKPINNAISKIIEKLFRFSTDSQSNFDKMVEGGVQVAVISISPIEKGFGIIDNKALLRKINIILKLSISNDTLAPKKIYEIVLGMPKDFAAKLFEHKWNQANVNYYEELTKYEIGWLLEQDSERNITPSGKKYSIRFPKDALELKQNLKTKSVLNIILSIEGIHALAPVPAKGDMATWRDKGTNSAAGKRFSSESTQEILKNINELGRINRPVFWISLCHLFWNGVAGHSQSFEGTFDAFLDQDTGMHLGLSGNAEKIIEELASTRDIGNNLERKPILIDIKHMSAKSRKEYYLLRRKIQREKSNGVYRSVIDMNQYPIVCSHTGVCSLYNSLKEWQEFDSKSKKQKKSLKKKTAFYESSINLCLEDLKEIFKSNGLIGMQLDEKRIMGKMVEDEIKDIQKNKYGIQIQKLRKRAYIKAIWGNIFYSLHLLDQVGGFNDEDLAKAWDMFCIGSDFDGLVNHLDDYPDMQYFSILRNDMKAFLFSPDDIRIVGKFYLTKNRMAELKFGLSDQSIIDKIFEKNALEFLMKNFQS